MAGINHDPLSDIQNIRELLKDYAPGFAFLKELLQNADDGGASTLRLVWSPGLKDASHPLLRAPALLALNDGRFSKSDRDSLMRMGLGNKGANAGKIGKFGLGTKSIFHVAEAFFFLESTGDPDLRNILNPWSPRHHTAWDEVKESDWNTLATACGIHGEGLEMWFAIWIPLRRESDLDGIKPIQTGANANPGEEPSCPQSLKDPIQHRSPRLGELLPLLRHLNVVEFHAAEEKPLHIRIDRKQGTIEHDVTAISYAILSYDDPARAEPWRERASWPQVFETLDDGDQESRPDKASWSHSITLTTSPAQKKAGCLRIYWSVFLPVGNKPYIEVSIADLSRDISLFLHGYFFLNSSRTQIGGLEDGFPSNNRDDPTGICLDWNHELACTDEGLLPALLPSLIKWMDDDKLRSDEVLLLTKAIYHSPLWEAFKNHLTATGSLLFCCRHGAWAWCWIPSKSAVAIIPRVDSVEKQALLEGLTGNAADDVAHDNIILAVDFSERRALCSKTAPFDAECLVRLRIIVGDSTQRLSDEEAELLVEILGAVNPDALPPEWEDAPLFRVKYCGTASWSRVTLQELRQLAANEDLFRQDEHNLASVLAKATARDDAPAIAGHRAGGYVELPNLTFERAAGWLLKQNTLSPDPTQRRPLLGKFSGRERLGTLELNAIRFLCHANPSFRDDDSTPLYFATGQSNDLWNDVFRVTLTSNLETWRLIEHAFAKKLSENLKQRSCIHSCSRDNWPSFIEKLGENASEIDFSSAKEKVLEWVLKETPEEHLHCLHTLKIHRLASGEMAAASDGDIWLQGELNVPENLEESWQQLRKKARIIKRSENELIHLRQKALFKDRVLDVSGALKLAADSGNPKLFSDLILHLLGAGTPRSGSEAIGSLKSAQWLPLSATGGVAIWTSPDQMLHLKGAESILDRVLSDLAPHGFLSSERLKKNVRDSKGWATLTAQILQPANDVFEVLSDLFKQQSCPYNLGFSAKINNENLEWWLAVAKDCDGHKLFPARPLLAVAYENETWRDSALTMAQVLARPFEKANSGTRYQDVLNALQELYSKEGNDKKAPVLQVISDYLRGARECGAWDQLRQNPDLELLSQSRKWKSIRKLAPPCNGVQESALLHSVLAEALGLSANAAPLENQNEGTDGSVTLSENESARNLRRGLKPFCDKLPHKAVAILPSLLGSEKPTVEFAEELLDGISVASIRDELIPADAVVEDQAGGRLRDRSKNWGFRVELIEGETVSLESVAGPVFQARLKCQFDSIFLPNPNGQLIRWMGDNLQALCLADPSRFVDLTESRLQEILLESVRNLLWWAYVHKSPKLESIFEKFANLGQMSLGVARQEILMSADTQLQLLGVRPKALEEARGIANESRSRLAEAEAGIGDSNRLRDEGREKEQVARELFQKILDGDSHTHEDLVGAIRRRIQQQQYELDSIPFEILQNADDAASELLQSVDLDSSDASMATKFVIRSDNHGLRFFYGGRPVNDACGQTGPQGARWRRDLVKMLLLNGSDKNIDEDEQVTGKFGLGFKSVFLLSPRPLVMSGALAFEIMGGIWPRPLPEADARELNAEADGAFGTWSRRTCISLTGEAEAKDKSLARFLQLAPWTPVFARSLKVIVSEVDGERSSCTWSPQKARHSSQFRVGQISIFGTDHQHLELTDGKIQWLLLLKKGRFEPLPDFVPWLWVTAPTREPSHGFILNGPFSLDPGRTRLSKQDEDVTGTNQQLFQRAATLLFDELSKVAADFENLASDLSLDEKESFWQSVWQLLTKIPNAGDFITIEGSQHLSLALWKSTSRGYSKLISEHRVIPKDLPPPMNGLTSLGELKWSLSGWLASESGSRCLAIILNRDLLDGGITEAFCSQSIAQQLRIRCSANIETINLTGLIRKLSGLEKRLNPEACQVIAENLLVSLDETKIKLDDALNPQEKSELTKLGQDLQFLSGDNTWELPQQLIAGTNHNADKDEALRFAFAPASRILSGDYSADGTRLFLCLRVSLNADSEQLADWIREPSSDAHLKAGLTYVAVGKLRQKVALDLGLRWLRDTREQEVFQQLDSKTQQSIELVFKSADAENERRGLQGKEGWDEPEPPDFGPDEPTLPLIDVKAILEAWNMDRALELFTISGSLGELVLPNSNEETLIARHLCEPTTLDGKAAWYRLLCLGCTLGLPLGIHAVVQVKRLWNEDLGPEFWKATIPDSLGSLSAPDFNTNLDSFFEEKIHQLFRNENAAGENAAFWRRVFYDFRKMHHFVFRNDFAETIMDFARCEEADGHALINFFKTGKIPDVMQDTSNPRYRGVIGQSMTAPLLFVMRELRRLGLLDERFEPACYYMNGPARRVACWLGWLDEGTRREGDFSTLVSFSEQIHTRMQKELPDLDLYYDLPLQLYAFKHPRDPR